MRLCEGLDVNYFIHAIQMEISRPFPKIYQDRLNHKLFCPISFANNSLQYGLPSGSRHLGSPRKDGQRTGRYEGEENQSLPETG